MGTGDCRQPGHAETWHCWVFVTWALQGAQYCATKKLYAIKICFIINYLNAIKLCLIDCVSSRPHLTLLWLCITHQYTSLSGKANPLIKQVLPRSLCSIFFTNILPRGEPDYSLAIRGNHSQLVVGWCGNTFHQPWKLVLFVFHQFHQWIKLWEELFRKPVL